MTVRRGRDGFALVPADALAEERLAERGYADGDSVSVAITKARNPRFHRLAHAFGRMVCENVPGFEHAGPHGALKRLQWESGIGCDEMAAKVPGAGIVPIRIPLSLSFSSMDEAEFREVLAGLCDHVAREYWHGLTVDEIESMAAVMVGR